MSKIDFKKISNSLLELIKSYDLKDREFCEIAEYENTWCLELMPSLYYTEIESNNETSIYLSTKKLVKGWKKNVLDRMLRLVFTVIKIEM